MAGEITRLDELTWEDAATRLDETDYAAMAVGSIEQHSTHLPLGVDVIRAEEFLWRLGREGSASGLDLLVLPTLPFGYTEHHLGYPGTLTLSADTLTATITDIGRSLRRHDVDRFLIVNGHRGNERSILLAVDALQREHDLKTHYIRPLTFSRARYEAAFGDACGHAGAEETSEIEYYRPELVRTDRKATPELADWPETRPTRYTDDISDIGGTGDPTASDPEIAGRIIHESVEEAVDRLRADASIDDG